MRSAILLLATAAAIAAADTSPEGLPQLIRQALVNFEKTDASMRGYEFVMHDENKEFDPTGQPKRAR